MLVCLMRSQRHTFKRTDHQNSNLMWCWQKSTFCTHFVHILCTFFYTFIRSIADVTPVFLLIKPKRYIYLRFQSQINLCLHLYYPLFNLPNE